jgi:formate dehydrogenase beta subunit
VLAPGVAMASGSDGGGMIPERLVPSGLDEDRLLVLLERACAVVADLGGVSSALFALLAWHHRARPDEVLLLRSGDRALPFELRDLPVRPYDADLPEAASAARLRVARLLTIAAAGRARPRPRAAEVEAHLLDAVRALDAALARPPLAADLLLRQALLLRDRGAWEEAGQRLESALALDRGLAPAWRELAVVRERTGAGDAEAAYRVAIAAGDYEAMVGLALLLDRQGREGEALRLLERAGEVTGGQLNLVLPTVLLRAAHAGRPDLFPWERERLAQVRAIRRRQARAEPPEDAPWSCFDAALASVLLGARDEACELLRSARAHCRAGWETETLGRSLDRLDRAAFDTADLWEIAGIAPRAAPTPAPEVPAGPPYRAAVRAPDWYAENVPCLAACPVGTDAGAYVGLIAGGEFEEAYRVARGPNPFASVCGRVCAAPCEDACRRGAIDAPVAIRPLKRFLTERHGVEGPMPRLHRVLDGSRAPCLEGEAYVSHLQKLAAAGAGGRRVAVVGGGPAGLACAHDLAFLGHLVTLFEASHHLGGMMRDGIPRHRLPRDVLDLEVQAILELGVEVRLGEGLDRERTLDALIEEGGFEAVFLGSGASRGKGMTVEGSHLDGVVRAIDFLINANLGYRVDLGARVVVVGGGNVAVDVARTARLGRMPAGAHGALAAAIAGRAREVHVVARPPFGEWPAQRSVHGRAEVEEARREGVVFHPLRGLGRILGTGGRVSAVELVEVVRITDTHGRYAPVYGGDVAERIDCDAVVLAVGQRPDLSYLGDSGTVRTTPQGLLEVDRKTLSTTRRGVFAGGDAAFGPRTLIEAVAEGKRAARQIHAYLTAGRTVPARVTFTRLEPREVPVAPEYDHIERRGPPCVAAERRTGIAEVDGAYDEGEAVRQAKRCLACHVQTVYDQSLCIACGRCTEVCPHACLAFVAPGEVASPDLEAVLAGAGAADLVLVKDETACIRCALCAERCPTGAMAMERFDLLVEAVPA